MDGEALKAALAPSLKVDIWHTLHPYGEQRFTVHSRRHFATLGLRFPQKIFGMRFSSCKGNMIRVLSLSMLVSA